MQTDKTFSPPITPFSVTFMSRDHCHCSKKGEHSKHSSPKQHCPAPEVLLKQMDSKNSPVNHESSKRLMLRSHRVRQPEVIIPDERRSVKVELKNSEKPSIATMDGDAVWSWDIFTFAALGNGILNWSGRYIKNEKMVLLMPLQHPELYN